MKYNRPPKSTTNGPQEEEVTHLNLSGENLQGPKIEAASSGDHQVEEKSEEKDDDTTDRLATHRANLSDPDALEVFDAKVQTLGEVKALLAFDKMAQGNGGLEAVLKKQVKKPVETNDPFGVAVGEVNGLDQWATSLMQDIQQQPFKGNNYRQDGESPNSGSGDWLKKLKNELSHLTRLKLGQREASQDFVDGIRNNIGGIQAEFDDAVRMGQGSLVNNDVVYSGGHLDIDNISADESVWSEVKNKAPFGLQSTSWTDEVKPKALRMLAAAAESPYKDKVKTLRFVFPKGVTDEVYDSLKQLGFAVDGPRVEAPKDTGSDSSDSKVDD